MCVWLETNGVTGLNSEELHAYLMDSYVDEETKKLKTIFGDVVVNGWAQRCGTNSCVENWNNSVGAKVGVKAKFPN